MFHFRWNRGSSSRVPPVQPDEIGEVGQFIGFGINIFEVAIIVEVGHTRQCGIAALRIDAQHPAGAEIAVAQIQDPPERIIVKGAEYIGFAIAIEVGMRV